MYTLYFLYEGCSLKIFKCKKNPKPKRLGVVRGLRMEQKEEDGR